MNEKFSIPHEAALKISRPLLVLVLAKVEEKMLFDKVFSGLLKYHEYRRNYDLKCFALAGIKSRVKCMIPLKMRADG